MTEELKPCATCGHDGVLQSSYDGEVEWVLCINCGREGPLAYSADEATRRWNAGEVRAAAPTRLTHSAEKQALIEALEAVVEAHDDAANYDMLTAGLDAAVEQARSPLLSMRNNGHGY